MASTGLAWRWEYCLHCVNKNMRDPVPAIIEAAATGEIAEIFGDIRRVLGVDVVNLIWRHLATIDGALAWTWTTLRPVYEDGTIAAEAAALHADLDLPALPGIPAEAFVALGLRGDDISAIRDTLAAYDRTNAMALIALSALLSRTRRGAEPAGCDTAARRCHPRRSATQDFAAAIAKSG